MSDDEDDRSEEEEEEDDDEEGDEDDDEDGDEDDEDGDEDDEEGDEEDGEEDGSKILPAGNFVPTPTTTSIMNDMFNFSLTVNSFIGTLQTGNPTTFDNTYKLNNYGVNQQSSNYRQPNMTGSQYQQNNPYHGQAFKNMQNFMGDQQQQPQGNTNREQNFKSSVFDLKDESLDGINMAANQNQDGKNNQLRTSQKEQLKDTQEDYKEKINKLEQKQQQQQEKIDQLEKQASPEKYKEEDDNDNQQPINRSPYKYQQAPQNIPKINKNMYEFNKDSQNIIDGYYNQYLRQGAQRPNNDKLAKLYAHDLTQKKKVYDEEEFVRRADFQRDPRQLYQQDDKYVRNPMKGSNVTYGSTMNNPQITTIDDAMKVLLQK